MPRRFQFSLRALMAMVLGFACATAAFRAGSPLWWAIWLVALGLLAGVSAYRAARSRSATRAAYITMAAIASVGVTHVSVAGYPWTGSWMLGLAWTEATTGNGWCTGYGASALGINYAVSWLISSLLGGAVAWLIFGTRRFVA